MLYINNKYAVLKVKDIKLLSFNQIKYNYAKVQNLLLRKLTKQKKP